MSISWLHRVVFEVDKQACMSPLGAVCAAALRFLILELMAF